MSTADNRAASPNSKNSSSSLTSNSRFSSWYKWVSSSSRLAVSHGSTGFQWVSSILLDNDDDTSSIVLPWERKVYDVTFSWSFYCIRFYLMPTSFCSYKLLLLHVLSC